MESHVEDSGVIFAAKVYARRHPMAAMLIKALTALVVLIAVPIALAELCIIVVGLWTLCHWPKGGWKDD